MLGALLVIGNMIFSLVSNLICFNGAKTSFKFKVFITGEGSGTGKTRTFKDLHLRKSGRHR